MLLNEFLKEHRKVEEQEVTITQLRKDFQATVAQLTAQLQEQAAQIQKVRAQLATGGIRCGGPGTNGPQQSVKQHAQNRCLIAVRPFIFSGV